MTREPFPYTSDDFREELARSKKSRLFAIIAVIAIVLAALIIAALLLLR